MSFVWLVMHLIPLLSQLYLVCLLPLSLWILLIAITWHLTRPYFLNLNLRHTLLIFTQQLVSQCLVIIQVSFRPPTSQFLVSLMFLTFLTIYFLWDNQLSQVITLSLIILGVLCRIHGQDKSLGPILELGVCFPWTTFVFHLLLLFLLLQLLQFLLFLPFHFGMSDLVTHLPLEYNTWLLEVCQIQCPQKILIMFHAS